MPLALLKIGETRTVKKITGKDDTKRFLAGLGFIEGCEVKVISETGGNMILNVKDTRVALDRDIARRIVV